MCRERATHINTVRAKLLQTRFKVLCDGCRLMDAGRHRVDLGGQRQAALLPAGLARVALLQTADVQTGRVDLVVAVVLEEVQRLFQVLDIGDTGALLSVGAKGHQT